MLMAIRLNIKRLVRASADLRLDGPFACPQCRQAVALRLTEGEPPHFRHVKAAGCRYGRGETALHRHIKHELFERLSREPDVTGVQLELPLDEVRPDVFARIRGVPVAFEVQLSSLPVATILERTEAYARLGIAVLWLCAWHPLLATPRYCPRPFERWLHAAYFGRVYFWKRGLTAIPYHFREHRIEVPERRWHDEHGRNRVSRRHSFRSKRHRMPVAGAPLNLARDFQGVWREAWRAGGVSVPRCRVYMNQGRSLGFRPTISNNSL